MRSHLEVGVKSGERDEGSRQLLECRMTSRRSLFERIGAPGS